MSLFPCCLSRVKNSRILPSEYNSFSHPRLINWKHILIFLTLTNCRHSGLLTLSTTLDALQTARQAQVLVTLQTIMLHGDCHLTLLMQMHHCHGAAIETTCFETRMMLCGILTVYVTCSVRILMIIAIYIVQLKLKLFPRYSINSSYFQFYFRTSRVQPITLACPILYFLKRKKLDFSITLRSVVLYFFPT